MFGAGGSAVIAKKMGEGRLQEACEDLSLLTLLALGAALLVSLIGFAALRPILQLLGANTRLYPYCRDYFAVNLLGFPAYMLQLIFQSYFVAAGPPNWVCIPLCSRELRTPFWITFLLFGFIWALAERRWLL